MTVSVPSAGTVDQQRRTSSSGVAFWLVVATALTLPLEFTKQWFPVSWIEVSRVLMVAAIAVRSVEFVRQRERPARHWLAVAMVLMVATAVLSAVMQFPSIHLKDVASEVIYLAFALTVGGTIRSVEQLRTITIAVARALHLEIDE